MSDEKKRPIILIADDDTDDCLFAREALAECGLHGILRFVADGEELMDYLKGRGKYALVLPPRPQLILLDLNMPKKDGRQSLRELKSDRELHHIPVVVLTTSRAEEDISHTYKLGASSYIAKPLTFEGLVKAMKTFCQYWFETVELPPMAP